jgi:hypothetical protein
MTQGYENSPPSGVESAWLPVLRWPGLKPCERADEATSRPGLDAEMLTGGYLPKMGHDRTDVRPP